MYGPTETGVVGVTLGRTGSDPDVTVPDVTVVLAVYNTMPYLTECLTSLVEQSIGMQRLEVVAVDDGSTDGSGEELDRWARSHPGTIKLVRQPNSGGPAAPNNCALRIATGRYVFFLGADDRLGREALERLVATADELDADIVLGRMIGTGGRQVNQAVYRAGNRDDIDLVNSPLPWALSNTKLFRRAPIEEHEIRYPEEIRSCSDQAFTLRAIAVARRIAVRADYDFYYAVRRADASNITYRTSLSEFVHDAAVVMDIAEDVLTDPAAVERVRHRHFTWELGKLLGSRFVEADPDERERVQVGLRKLADTYLTESIRQKLDVHHRVRISVAQYGQLADLVAVASFWKEGVPAPIIAEAGRFYVPAPGFRDPAKAFPDDWFDVGSQSGKVQFQTAPAKVVWSSDRSLVVSWPTSLVRSDEDVRVSAGDLPASQSRLEPVTDGSLVEARFTPADLVAGTGRQRRRRLKFTVSTGELSRTTNVTGPPDTTGRRVLHRVGLRYYLIEPQVDDDGLWSVLINAVTPRRIAGRLVRQLRSRR